MRTHVVNILFSIYNILIIQLDTYSIKSQKRIKECYVVAYLINQRIKQLTNHNTTRRGTTQHDRHGTTDTTRHDRHNTTRYDTTRRHATTRHDMTRYDTAQSHSQHELLTSDGVGGEGRHNCLSPHGPGQG